MCSSQRSQAFELATTTERLQVGGGYTVLIKNTRLTLHPPSWSHVFIFNLLQVFPSVPSFEFTAFFIPSFNPFSGYFYVSLNLVSVLTGRTLIKFVIPLL